MVSINKSPGDAQEMALRWMKDRLGEDNNANAAQTRSPSAEDKIKVIIVGGSIAGLACARALLNSGVCEVVVLEKAKALSPAGAGLALDERSCNALGEWGLGEKLVAESTPLNQERNWAKLPDKQEVIELCKDENFCHRAVHWSDVHRIIHDSLPSGIIHFGNDAKSPQVQDDLTISVTVTELGTGSTRTVTGDVLVAADGAASTMRELNWPGAKKRYSGYCAWRGVLDCSELEEFHAEIKSYYKNLGECIYFEMVPTPKNHAVIYELQGKRVNWLWYINQEEPEMKGTSVTIKADEETIAGLYRDADRELMPTLAKLIKETPKPFVNVIYDKEPFQEVVRERIVLVGDAAHATTPHGLRSTNMSIGDAHALGKAFRKHGLKDVDAALAEFQSERLPACIREVLFSRHLGRLKQGLITDPAESFPWRPNDQIAADRLLVNHMDSFQVR